MDLHDPTPLTTQADLEGLWRDLMGPLGFSRASLWFVMLTADRRPVPQVSQVDDVPARPDKDLRPFFGSLKALLDEVEPGGSWAFLRSRPGTARVTDDDRAWARGVSATCLAVGLPVEVVHLATDTDVLPLPLDVIGAVA